MRYKGSDIWVPHPCASVAVLPSESHIGVHVPSPVRRWRPLTMTCLTRRYQPSQVLLFSSRHTGGDTHWRRIFPISSPLPVRLRVLSFRRLSALPTLHQRNRRTLASTRERLGALPNGAITPNSGPWCRRFRPVSANPRERCQTLRAVASFASERAIGERSRALPSTPSHLY